MPTKGRPVFDLSESFDRVMTKMKFRGDAIAAERYRTWRDANTPTVWDHLCRLWRTLRSKRT